MKKTIIAKSIAAMSTKDKRRFLFFVRTPYFNTRQDLIALSAVLLDEEIDLVELTKQQVFDQAFPEKKYNGQEFRLLLSYLKKKVELFFSVEVYLKDESAQSLALLSALKKQQDPHLYQKKLIRYRDKTYEQKDWAFFYGQYRLEEQNLEVLVEAAKSTEVDYAVLSDKLDRFYLSLKLRNICTGILFHSLFDSQYSFPDLDLTMKLANQKKFLSFPTISIYYYFIKLITGNKNYFATIKETLFANRHSFSQSEFQDVFKMILNFYIRNINETSISYVPEALAFYKKGLDLNLLMKNGYLSQTTFSNIVGMAIKEKELEWVDSFLNTYTDLLNKKERKEVYSLNKARLEYSLKNFDSAIFHINNVNYKQFFPAVTARLLQIKIYWEIGQMDLLFQDLHSLKYYVQRKKVIGYYYELLNNTIKFIRKLAELNQFDKKEKINFKKQILQEENLLEKEWILEQLEMR